MALPAPEFPVPQDGDSDDVSTALQTAIALWISGDGEEAVRWLRRAADAAEQAGDDMRALELARKAADLVSVKAAARDSQPTALVAEASEPSPAAPERAPSIPTASARRPEPQESQAVQPAVPRAPSAPQAPRTEASASATVKAGELDALPALLVAIKPSVRDEGLFMMRVLEEGRPAPAGSHRAVVILLDKGSDPFGSDPKKLN
jgi:hypothetical protein